MGKLAECAEATSWVVGAKLVSPDVADLDPDRQP